MKDWILWALVVAVCGMPVARAAAPVAAVGIENQYADVIGQIGGRDVRVSAIESNPNTDPHSFEASPAIARRMARASLIVENGLGYDAWAGKIIAATPRAGRWVINVQHLLGVADSTPNPHLWYDPNTMKAVATAVAADLSVLRPEDAGYFKARLARFDGSLKPLFAAIAAFRTKHPGVAVAVTEPVGNYLLEAIGAKIETPFALQAAIMNGTDPSPQDVATQNALLRDSRVKVFVYNRQVTDPLTRAFLALAVAHHVPVVGVYETMPAPGYDYQSWMMAELRALDNAVTRGMSTRSLLPKRK